MEAKTPTPNDERLPRHVAIIMDGNGRWAKQRFLPRTAGHRAGVAAVRKAVEHCASRGIEVLTLFAFSSENWRRPQQEVSVLMDLFLATLDRETEKLHQNKVKLSIIGDRSALSRELQEKIVAVEELTRHNGGMTLVIAANYGGRWDILNAARMLAAKAAEGLVNSAEIDEALFESHLALARLPDPDLFIRTGGEQRVSNFLLWQLAYTELFFTPTLWPDVDESLLDQAFSDYASRQRRFGYTGEQLESINLNKNAR